MSYEVTAADVTRTARVAARYARRTNTRHMSDEWASAGLMGLDRAARTYTPSRGDFWAFAVGCVWCAITDAARAWTPRGYRTVLRDALAAGGDPDLPRVHSIHHGVASDSGDPADLAGEIPDGRDPVGWEVEWHDELDGLSRRLTRYSAPVFLAYYGRAVNGNHVARQLGLSRSNVGRCMNEAHRLLAESAGRHGDRPAKAAPVFRHGTHAAKVRAIRNKYRYRARTEADPDRRARFEAKALDCERELARITGDLMELAS